MLVKFSSSSTAVSLLVELNVGVIGLSFRLTLLLVPPLGGEGGGGMAIAEGIRARGVASEGRPDPTFFGVPSPDILEAGLGVDALDR